LEIRTDLSLASYDPLSPEEVQRVQQVAHDHPDRYFTDLLGISPWAKQIEIAEAINLYEKTLVYSCVSSGKSFIGGAIVPWWLNSRYPARVFIIAPTERQIKINLWSEFSRVYYGSRVPLGPKPMTLDWKLDDKGSWLAKGFSPKDALAVFGIHGPNDLIIFDDAQGIPLDVFDAFENASASGTARYIFFCNPAFVSGPLYDAITEKRGDMHTIQIDAFHTPNVMAGRVVVPGLIIKEKVDAWVKKFGWDSDFVRVKVRALPPKQEPDTLIPIDWLEIAKCREVPQKQGGITLGIDVARFGDDESVIGAKEGRQYLPEQPEWIMNGNDTMQVSGRGIKVAKDLKAVGANVDEIGIGAGVVDRMTEVAREQKLKLSIHGINVAEKPHDKEQFVNLRAEMWWASRESLDPKNPAAMSLMGCSDELIADLSAMKYSVDSAGRIKVESKEETKKRLGRSPDRGDAYALAVFESYLYNVKPAVAFSNQTGLPRLPSWL
jgi:hypothetical protein